MESDIRDLIEWLDARRAAHGRADNWEAFVTSHTAAIRLEKILRQWVLTHRGGGANIQVSPGTNPGRNGNTATEENMFEIITDSVGQAHAIAAAIATRGIAVTCITGARIKVYRDVADLLEFIEDLNAAIADGKAAEAARVARRERRAGCGNPACAGCARCNAAMVARGEA